jgi:hypothetical protein
LLGLVWLTARSEQLIKIKMPKILMCCCIAV